MSELGVELQNENTVQAKPIVVNKLPLSIKLGRGVTSGGDPKGCQGIKGDLHNGIFSDSPHIQMEMPRDMMTDYRLRRRGIVGSATYLLTWQLARQVRL